jgi:hypothetical protein
MRRSRIPAVVLLAGAIGCALAYAILYFCNAYDYPLDVGGRPLNSIPADIPILFETTVLFAGVTALLAFLFRCGMPRLHHPIHEVPGCERITLDRFWLEVHLDGRDGTELRELHEAMATLGARTRARETARQP